MCLVAIILAPYLESPIYMAKSYLVYYQKLHVLGQIKKQNSRTMFLKIRSKNHLQQISWGVC